MCIRGWFRFLVQMFRSSLEKYKTIPWSRRAVISGGPGGEFFGSPWGVRRTTGLENARAAQNTAVERGLPIRNRLTDWRSRVMTDETTARRGRAGFRKDVRDMPGICPGYARDTPGICAGTPRSRPDVGLEF